METIIQYFPLFALLLCNMLYIFEDRLNRKWVFSVGVTLLHIFTIIYFLVTESSMEIVLLFLTASLAAALTISLSKSEKIEKQENNHDI